MENITATNQFNFLAGQEVEFEDESQGDSDQEENLHFSKQLNQEKKEYISSSPSKGDQYEDYSDIDKGKNHVEPSDNTSQDLGETVSPPRKKIELGYSRY